MRKITTIISTLFLFTAVTAQVPLIYDNGPIIIQRAVPVLDDDTPNSLATRVFQEECEAYPEAIRLFAAGRLKIEGRKVRIIGA